MRTAPCAVIAATDAPGTALHGVLVERAGQRLAERYFAGPDKRAGDLLAHDVSFTADTLHDTRSISKSVVGLLVGRALQQGLIPSLDTPVLALLRPAAPPADPAWQRITMRHLLTMTAGLKWTEDATVSLFSDETRMELSRDMTAYVLDRPVAEAPGHHYVYNSGATVLLGAVLEKVSGQPLLALARQALFEPLGIQKAEWITHRSGQAMAHAGLRLTPRDLARIGRLMLDHGRWQGQPLLDESFVRAALQGQFAAEEDWRFGYLWRLGSTRVQGRPLAWAGAFGNGGQRLFLVPELDLVVVITAGRYNQSAPGNGRPSHQLLAQLLDALVRPGP